MGSIRFEAGGVSEWEAGVSHAHQFGWGDRAGAGPARTCRGVRSHWVVRWGAGGGADGRLASLAYTYIMNT